MNFGIKKLNGSSVVAAALTTFNDTLAVLARGITLLNEEILSNSTTINKLMDKQDDLCEERRNAEAVQANIKKLMGL